MENASKALIIAGAILIAILLISVGILVMNSVNKPLDEVNSEADSMDAQIYNSKFRPYFGNEVSGRDLKNLLQLIMINNVGKPKKEAITLVFYYMDPNTGKYNQNCSYSGLLPSTYCIQGGVVHIYMPEHIAVVNNLILNDSSYKVAPTRGCTDTSRPDGYFKNGRIACIKVVMNP